MNDTPEFDDELLSAYLDDELSAEERARVEEHLAANPQARKLLEELRGVSQAIQALPPAKLGVDLSGAIVRQAERAAKEEARTVVGGSSDSAWSMPIGRSKRSWFWAGAALAAGLMLMFFERGMNERGNVPNQVAMRDRETFHEPMGHTEMRAVPPKLAEGRAKAKEEKAVDLFADTSSAAGAVALRTEAANASASGAVSLERGREMAAFDAKRKLGIGVEADTVAEDIVAEDIVVVHVNTTPEAIRNRVFDAVLVKNSIEPERPATAAAGNTAPGDVDVVLVEAAPMQIYGCMDALKKDAKNYLAIEVDEQSVANQRVKQLDDRADHFALYNRGIVPAEQKVASNRFYYSQLDSGAAAVAQEQADKVAAAAPPPMQVQSRQQEALDRSDATMGDAAAADAAAGAPTTVFGGGVAGSQLAEGALYSQSTASDQYYGANVQNNARRAVQKLATKADMLQVLFVLSCPSDMPVPPAATAVESAASQPAATVSEPAAAPPPATAPAREGIDDR